MNHKSVMMSADHKTGNTLVSVIVPAYNAGKYISAAINSVISQEYRNWELIIVDDGSTDNTKELVAPFLSDKRIAYYNITNGGVSNARNYGADKAGGEYLCFLDADDFFYPKNLSEKVKVLNGDSKIALVHADVDLTNEAGERSGKLNTGLSGENLHLNLLMWEECVIPAPSSIMIRKDAFENIGKWDPRFSTAADQDLFIRLCSRYKIERIHHVLTAYRVVSSSMGKNIAVFEKDHLAVYHKAKQNGLFPDKAFEKKCFANLHLMIAASWRKQNKAKTLRHLFKSVLFSPYAILRRMKQKNNK